MGAVERWAEELRGWAIPEEILAAAPEPPYGFPAEPFRRRAEAARRADPSPTALRALEALPEGGTVLDVGCGAGATSLPLARRAGRIVGVDASPEMLERFREQAAEAGVPAEAVQGTWPDVAHRVEAADVVVCGHVLYNVQDLAPFVDALGDRVRRRVVCEITERHPWAWMAGLWLRFHGLPRPAGPTADDAEAALRELGIDVRREDHLLPPTPAGFERKEDAVALIRRRLCLGLERDPEVEKALGEWLREREGLWSAGPDRQVVVTLWWDV
ncbi:MAG TPA: methyltransferase domain-containing protein [Actinomycetota bacterium]|nr:methyltransferase domain-containing protein [Actinomycetota bacterium]